MWTSGRRGTRTRRTPRGWLCTLGLLWAVGTVGLLSDIGAAGQATALAPAKPRLAVLPFAGAAGGVPEGYGLVPAAGIRSALQQMRSLRLVDAGEIVAASERLGLALTTELDDPALIRLATELQVRGVIAGRYTVDGDTVAIQARLVDLAGTARVIQDEAVNAPRTDFLDAPGRITKRALQHFRVRLTEWDERRLESAFVAGTASPDAYALYARAAWEQGLGSKEGHERAVALLTKALEADANFAQARVALGVSLFASSAAGNLSNRWRASQEYRKALQLNAKLAEAHKLLGDMLVTSPRRLYDQAIQSYQSALEVWPDYAEARVGLGDARQAKGQYDDAIEEYKKALAIEPANARVYLGMGKIYYNEKQQYHESVAAYQQAIALDPKLLDAHLSLGELYEEKGLYDEAVARYTHVLSLEPKHPGATYGLALAYEKVNVKKAIEQWERYIELASSLPSEKDWVDIAKKHLAKLQRGEKPN